MKGTCSTMPALIHLPTRFETAATFILNDDVESAEDGLAKGTSTFHKVGAASLRRLMT